MLDEPLGALDRSLREQLMNELRAILKQVGVTALYVTHDQEEAFAVSDRVLIMRARPENGEGGWIEQADTPAAVYRYPRTAYVARFLGFRNLLDATVLGPGSGDPHAGVAPHSYRARTALGDIVASDVDERFAVGEAATLLVRPEAADVRPTGERGENLLAGRLISASFRGSYYLIRTEHSDGVVLTCEASATDEDLPAAGEPLTLSLDPTAVTLLRPE